MIKTIVDWYTIDHIGREKWWDSREAAEVYRQARAARGYSDEVFAKHTVVDDGIRESVPWSWYYAGIVFAFISGNCFGLVIGSIW